MHIPEDNRAGLYFTAIFHLAVIIVLLLAGIGSELGVENSFVMDFSKQEQKEKEITYVTYPNYHDETYADWSFT